MAHRSSVLQKNPFQYLPWSHHTLYIFCIGYDTIHRKLDPSKTVIKTKQNKTKQNKNKKQTKKHSLRCGHRPMWWMKFFIWDSIFPCWFKFKKKSKKDHYISISSIHQYWLPHCMKHTCYGVILDVNYWMNGLEMREREKGGEIYIFLIYVY